MAKKKKQRKAKMARKKRAKEPGLPPEARLYFAVCEIATIASNWSVLKSESKQRREHFDRRQKLAESIARARGDTPASNLDTLMPTLKSPATGSEGLWTSGVAACDRMHAAALDIAAKPTSAVKEELVTETLERFGPARMLFEALGMGLPSTLAAETKQLRELWRWAERTKSRLWAAAEVAAARGQPVGSKKRSRAIKLVDSGHAFARPVPTQDAADVAGERSDELLNKLSSAGRPIGGTRRKPVAELEDIISALPDKAQVLRRWANREYPES